jgi:hypothetical protein
VTTTHVMINGIVSATTDRKQLATAVHLWLKNAMCVRTRFLELRRSFRSQIAWRRTDLDHPPGEWSTGRVALTLFRVNWLMVHSISHRAKLGLYLD